MAMTRRFKVLLVGGVIVRLIGVAMSTFQILRLLNSPERKVLISTLGTSSVIRYRTADDPTVMLVLCQLLQGIGGGSVAITMQVAVQVCVRHAGMCGFREPSPLALILRTDSTSIISPALHRRRDRHCARVAHDRNRRSDRVRDRRIAIHELFARQASGAPRESAIWNAWSSGIRRLIEMLLLVLPQPDLPQEELDRIFGSLQAAVQYPLGSEIRTGITHAWVDV